MKGVFGCASPCSFFLIAPLVSLSTMARMVEARTRSARNLKSAGYGPGAIARNLYTRLSRSVIGSASVLVSVVVFPRRLRRVFHHVHDTPIWLNRVNYAIIPSSRRRFGPPPPATLFACRKQLAAHGDTMRAKPPQRRARGFSSKRSGLCVEETQLPPGHAPAPVA